MATRHTLSDLRNSIQEIHRQAILERSNGEAANAAILARVKAEKSELLLQLTPELVNIALTKLLNEVSARKGNALYQLRGLIYLAIIGFPEASRSSAAKRRIPRS